MAVSMDGVKYGNFNVMLYYLNEKGEKRWTNATVLDRADVVMNGDVLMLTAKAETDDKVEGLDSGADDYMSKPFQIRELLARVRALLRRSGEISQSYRYGDFTLSFDTFELIGDNGERVRLTNKEYRLMETLVRNAKSVLSTERLMERVWDYDSEAEINVVWAYLSALRKKLEEIHSKYTVISMRGVGYQLGEKK